MSMWAQDQVRTPIPEEYQTYFNPGPPLTPEARTKAFALFTSSLAPTSKPGTLEDWQKSNPISCAKIIPRGGQEFEFPDDEPRYECVQSEGPTERRYSFYPEPAKKTHTLQEFHFIWKSADEALLTMVREWLLTQNPAGREIPPEKSDFWTMERYFYMWKWEYEDQFVALYSYNYTKPSLGTGFELHFIWRGKPLYAWQRRSERNEVTFFVFSPLDYVAQDYAISPKKTSRMEQAAREAGLNAHGLFDNASIELPEIIDRLSELDQLMHSAMDNICSMDANGPLYPPTAYLAAGLLSWRIEVADARSVSCKSFLTPYANWKYLFQHCSPDDCFALRDELRKNLATHYLNTRWGRQAFLEMARAYWTTDCNVPEIENANAFNIITRAEKYLAEYPDSDITLDLTLELAMAYEMWWCIGKFAPKGWIEADIFREDCQSARLKSMDYYRQALMQLTSDNPLQRLWIQNKIFLLEREENTHQDRYFVSGC